MVNYSHSLDLTFGALADPLRRSLLERLSGGERRVSDLARPFAVSLPAISRHLKVLEAAGLVVRTKVGREHRFRSDPAPILNANQWIADYAAAWTHQFARLDLLLASDRAAASTPRGDRHGD